MHLQDGRRRGRILKMEDGRSCTRKMAGGEMNSRTCKMAGGKNNRTVLGHAERLLFGSFGITERER